jgi:glycosyltransferase involved in cell wall biosynthesis
MPKPKIVIVIPAYNEEKKIAETVRAVLAHYKDVLVVDDRSSDRSAQIARDSGATVVSHPINRGQGAALETGNRFALAHGADIIVHFDADGQFLATEIDRLLAPILTGRADIVMGSRFMGQESEMPAFKRKVIMPLARFFLRLFYGAVLSDPQNGFRAMNREFANKLRIENDGAAHCTEIIVKAIKGGWRYEEVPVTVLYNHFGQGLFSGKGRGSGGIKILKSLLIQKLIK